MTGFTSGVATDGTLLGSITVTGTTGAGGGGRSGSWMTVSPTCVTGCTGGTVSRSGVATGWTISTGNIGGNTGSVGIRSLDIPMSAGGAWAGAAGLGGGGPP